MKMLNWNLKNEKSAIEAIKLAAKMSGQYYKKPIQIAYSGGKDSDVLLDLALKSGVKLKVIHNLTTADAPETMYHVKNKFKKLKDLGVETEMKIAKDKNGKRITMWNLIPQNKMPPTRRMRYCCSVFKETSGKNAIVLTGVRSKESAKRNERQAFEIIGKTVKEAKRWGLNNAMEVYRDAQRMPEVYDCQLIVNAKKNKKIIVNPIVNWSDYDVWTYIRGNGISYNPLYDEGFTRVGCIGCPLSGPKNMRKEFLRWPKYKKLYINAFNKMILERKKAGLKCDWKSGDDVMRWWLKDDEIKGQLVFFEAMAERK
jgi:phosphoadenosine phosphosulfate reductase